ncbi:CaiB/BaiF CoA-transferase family protein [Zwartia sp.]|uniref:CaiB/BaiF CoA transferase family protein n=1 Tax=Zwartia sp. TaxID=2978004 RepID=UPI0027229412|nr:CaiB/BaiF CoA-transferase family protein [Zwartia sp.]MDO9023469.1 CaiB/BaiF CoA-transferase family protein [Zwartia sp.]
MSKIQASSALSNLRVLDMSRVRAGPNCVRLLADFGADVIRIEPPKGVDPNEGMFAGNREGGDFQNLNRNKRAMTLNLKKPGALEIMMRLVKTADVVVENWRPDIKKKLGIDYESLAKVNPRIILASISGFGQEGPYAGRPGFDQIMQGMGGLMSVTGIPGQGPVRAGLAVADMSAGLYAGIGILTALLERERSGKGQWVHASLLHAQIAMMDFQAARYLNEGDVAGQAGNDHPTSTPMGLFEASDGVFNLGASGQGNWVRLCELMKHPEWIADPDFSNEKTRTVNRVRCNQILNEVFRTNTVEYWVEALNNAGVPAGPVYNVPQMFEDKHVKQANISKMVKDKAGKDKGFITQPAVLSRTPADVVTTAPQWGEHTQEVLSEVGYSAEEIAKFQEQGVV